jgi:uncharacterized membrane protein YphA (DoxX/SURF4 family)
MAQLAVLVAGLLLMAMSQASDVEEADPSTGFLSKEAQASNAMNSLGGLSDLKKFIVPTFSDVNHGNRPDALSHHNNLAEHIPAPISFMINDDKPIVHPVPHVQDTSALTSASRKPAIATKEEEKAAQKLLANGDNTPIMFSAIGGGLFALATMLGVYTRRGLSPATVPGLGDNIMEMKSHSEARADDVPGGLEWDPLGLFPSDPTAGLQPAVFTVEKETTWDRITGPKLFKTVKRTEGIHAVPLVPLRVIAGILMIHHGSEGGFWPANYGTPGFDGFVTYVLTPYFSFLPGSLETWSALHDYVEFWGGVLLAIGFLTRPAALSLLVTMVAAVYFHLASTGLQGAPFGHVENYSYNFEEPALYGLIFLLFWFNGPGPLSVDSIIYSKLAPDDED